MRQRGRHCLLTVSVLYLYLRQHSPGPVELASQRENHGNVSWVVRTPKSPIPASLQLLALYLKPRLSGLRALQHLLTTPSLLILIQIRDGGAMGRGLTGKGVLIIPPLVGPFRTSVGAQSTTQPRRADTLTPITVRESQNTTDFL